MPTRKCAESSGETGIFPVENRLETGGTFSRLRVIAAMPFGRLSILMGTLTIAALLFCPGCERPASPIEEGVYVWQRQWTQQVTRAVRSVDENISTVMPLLAEVSFPDPRAAPEIVSVPLDWEALSHSGKSITAVIRIGDSASRTGWNSTAIDHIKSLLAAMKNSDFSE